MSTPFVDYPAEQGGAALGARLRRLSDRIDREAAAIYAAYGVAFEQRWFGTLNQLIRFGPATGTELAARLGVTPAAVSQVATAMTGAGLISVRADPQDARRRVFAATSKGQNLADRLAPVWAALEAAARTLDAESGGLTAALGRLEAALDRSPLGARVSETLTKSGGA
jgi:MarR family transcriptional regulator, organic hydroperoxide resistance regulator